METEGTKTMHEINSDSSASSVDRPTMPIAGIPGKLYIGIDNGYTGAIAGLLPNGKVSCHPVRVTDLGRERFLDVESNLGLLQAIITGAGVTKDNLLVVYEQSQINPYFGHKSNHTNGKNGEFWRVLLSTEKIPFAWVNPKQWQKDMFRAIRGRDTKVMADLVRKQRFPSLDCAGLNKTELEGVNDALCIALWAREHNQ